MKLGYVLLLSTALFAFPSVSYSASHEMGQPVEEAPNAVRPLNKGLNLKWNIQSNGVCTDENGSPVGNLIGRSVILTDINLLRTGEQVLPTSLSVNGDAVGFGVKIHYSSKNFPYALVTLNSPLDARIKASKLYNKAKDKGKNKTDIGLSFEELLKIRKWAALEKDEGSLSSLRNLASLPSASAQVQYAIGSIEFKNENYDEAYDWLLKASKQNFGKADSLLGVMFEKGFHVKENKHKANEYYIKAYTNSSSKHEKFWDRSEDSMSATTKSYLAAADKGLPEAQYTMGLCYEKGLGEVVQNSELAIKWFEKAAMQGYREAECHLGMCYSIGMGVPKSDENALTWYKKAAEHGCKRAYYDLGLCYYTAQNYALAFKWVEKAAIQGDIEAQCTLGKYYQLGIGGAKNYEHAFKWFEKAANKGEAIAQYNMGVCYDRGRGVAQNLKLAFKWFEKAANQGLAEAMHNVGMYYAEGDGVRKDFDLAVKFLVQALEKGVQEALTSLRKLASEGVAGAQTSLRDLNLMSEAIDKKAPSDLDKALTQTELGYKYLTGDGVAPDEDRAFNLFETASHACTNAKCLLAYMYEKGKGTIKDETEAAVLYSEAAQAGDEEALKRLKKLALRSEDAQDLLSKLLEASDEDDLPSVE